MWIKSAKALLKPIVAKVPCGYHIQYHRFRMAGSFHHRSYLNAFRMGWKEEYMSELFEAAVKPGMTVVDGGAFIGWYTLVAAHCVGPCGRVLSFEPDVRNFRWLRKNVRRAGLEGRVQLFPKALDDGSRLRRLNQHDKDWSQNSLLPSDLATTKGGIQVETIALDEHSAGPPKLDVVKLDVEGSEVTALRGMQTLLQRSHPAVLFVEWNPAALIEAGYSPEQLVETLSFLGFDIKVIDEERRCLVDFQRFIEGMGEPFRCVVNLYCTSAPGGGSREPTTARGGRGNPRQK